MRVKIKITARRHELNAVDKPYRGELEVSDTQGKYPTTYIFDTEEEGGVGWGKKNAQSYCIINGDYETVKREIGKKIKVIEKLLKEWDKMFEYPDIYEEWEYEQKEKKFRKITK